MRPAIAGDSSESLQVAGYLFMKLSLVLRPAHAHTGSTRTPRTSDARPPQDPPVTPTRTGGGADWKGVTAPMHQSHGPTPARQLATMRQPLHLPALPAIIERAPRRPLPVPGRRGPLPRYGFVVAVIAAHDAEHRLGATLDALDTQTRRPDAVVVVADRCQDATVVTALTHGATVVETSGNHHGKAGALELALSEVLAMVDDDDVVLILDDDVAPAADFVAAGLARLWATPTVPTTPSGWRPAARRRWRGAERVPTPASVVHGSPVGPHPLGTHWPGGRGPRDGGATMVLAGALGEVASARADGTLPDPSGRYGVLDVLACDPCAELTGALASLGHHAVAPPGCTTTRHDPQPSTPEALFHHRRQNQHATLSALGAHGIGRSTRSAVATQARLSAEVSLPALAATTLGVVAVTGGPTTALAATLAVAAGLWVVERAVATRGQGRVLPVELLAGLARAGAGGAGVVAGTGRWLGGVRWRRPLWRHPASGQVLARRPAPFAAMRATQLVRVQGSAIAIERTTPAPDVVADRWRRRALGGCAGSLALVVAITLPAALPVPMAVLIGVWAVAVAVASTLRLLATGWRSRPWR